MTNSNIKTSSFCLAKKDVLICEDFCAVKTIDGLTVAILCDGVGSAKEGLEAAKRVCSYFINNFKNRPVSWSIEKSLKSFIKSINSILYQESMINYDRAELITTLSIVVIQGKKLYDANVGDTRVYLHRGEKLNQLSIDHVMNEKGFEHVLTQALGISENTDAYYFENIVKKGDKILLCSDGLYNTLSIEEIKENINNSASFLVKKASRKVNDNLLDDTTAVIVEILENDEVEVLKALNLEIPKKLKVGQDIDSFILQKPLVGNNRTWLCIKNNKKYVLKFPLFEATHDDKLLDSFVKESWNSKRLKAGFFPKSVIPKNRSYRYYVMQAIDGIDLKTYLKKQRLHIDDAINLTKTLINMSQYLLKFDLIHADIKPENIMILNRDNKLIFKIIDFGSMCEIYSLNSKAGTPSYLAPERFKAALATESTEIYSIGVTIYESLSKKFPYGEIEPFSTPLFKTMKSPKYYNNKIPLWLESIILRSTSCDTNLRYKHYSEMFYELENSTKVKTFYNKDVPLLKKNPLLFYQVGFFLMLILNIILFLK